jgi:PAS domain S-box-containing protein
MPEATGPRNSGESLRASELRYRRLFEAAKDGILILDAKTGEITDVNPFLVNLLGYKHDELVGTRLWEIGPFKDIKECQLAFLQLQDKEYIRYESLPLETKDGRPIAVEFVSNVYRVSGGTRVIQCNIRDITERKQAEEALRQAEQKYHNIFEEAIVGIFQSTPNGRYIVANPAMALMLGYDSPEELITSIDDISKQVYVDPHLRAEFRALMEKQGGVRNFECELYRKDGRKIWISTNARAIFKDGVITYYEGMNEDTTERKRLGEQLRQALKMEAVGQLAGGISHDFNNLLGIINGYSEILLENPRFGEVTRRRLGEILKAGQHASSLTRQLLAFSRKQILQPRVLSLNHVLAEVDKMLRRLIGEHIEVTTVLDPNLEAVTADPTQMEQVILNFCVNARDAMPEGGRVTIETANVEVDETIAAQHFPMEPGRYVRLAVSDTGIGMEKETLSHVFEPFFTTKGSDKGTGLGLATVYGIVKQSGGYVWAYSEPGQGSTFSVYLPTATEVAEPSTPEAKSREAVRGSETILLVEDAAPLREMTRELLEERGYTVLEAEDGKQALEVAERYEGSIALLLTDVVLPKMGGPSLAKSLLQRRSGMKVLYMSGYANQAFVDDGVLKPGTVFLQKPFAAEELAKKVRKLLDAPA